MKPLINTKPGLRALEEMVKTVDYYPPGVLLFESEEPKTMRIKGEVPMLVSWTSTGKRVGDPNQSLIVDKAGYGVIPSHLVDGKIKQKEFWKQQMTAMQEAGVTFRPELADK